MSKEPNGNEPVEIKCGETYVLVEELIITKDQNRIAIGLAGSENNIHWIKGTLIMFHLGMVITERLASFLMRSDLGKFGNVAATEGCVKMLKPIAQEMKLGVFMKPTVMQDLGNGRVRVRFRVWARPPHKQGRKGDAFRGWVEGTGSIHAKDRKAGG